ncbi:murein biosynthesis integral membrane protein MurJ [Dongshaea marina]|uniref:murein biosynthesis integral membrane protein MurJ n=1 Tax=Dongshaea marina TaxID=2047966 RepID=UPI000D3E046B|nr:lipid II flippase MurJ [Dongshaea marina]
MFKAIVISSLIVSGGLLLGRCSGFLREILLASVYGVSSGADVAILMLTLPDLLLSLLVGGAIGASLIPQFERKPQQARALCYQVSLLLLLLFTTVSAGVFLLAGPVVTLLAPGFEAGQLQNAIEAVRYIIPLLPLTVLCGVTTAYLHAQNKFLLPSLGTLIFNGCVISGLIFMQFDKSHSFALLAGFALLGAGIRYLSQLIQLRPSWTPLLSLKTWLPDRSLLHRYLQAMFSTSLLLLLPVIGRAFASYQGEGSVALFNYASKLVEFPLLIAVSFLSIVLFPRLAASYQEDSVLHAKLIKYGLQATLVLAVLISALLGAMSLDYTNLVFGWSLSSQDVVQIAHLCAIALSGFVFQALALFLSAIFNARGETHKPMLINGFGTLCLLLAFTVFADKLTMSSILWMMVTAYALIACLLLLAVNIESFHWSMLTQEPGFWGVLFLCAACGYGLISWWGKFSIHSGWLLLLGMSVGGLCLIAVGWAHPEFRTRLRAYWRGYGRV